MGKLRRCITGFSRLLSRDASGLKIRTRDGSNQSHNCNSINSNNESNHIVISRERQIQNYVHARRFKSIIPPMFFRSFSSHHSDNDDDVSDHNPIFLRNQYTGADVYLIGTAHVSERSSQEVIDLIRKVKPNQVLLELDPERLQKLQRMQDENGNAEDVTGHWINDVLNIFREPSLSVPSKLLTFVISNTYKAMKRMGFVPGGEFLAAIREAKKINAEIICGDQSAMKTVSNVGNAIPKDLPSIMVAMMRPPSDSQQEFMRQINVDENLSPKERMRRRVDSMLDRKKIRPIMKEMEISAPNVVRAILHDRDLILAQNIRKLKGPVVVAVVGLAHVDGIERRFRSGESVMDRIKLALS